jgi:SAM-dependent methyltransferase
MAKTHDDRVAEEQNRARWDETAPVHLKAYKEVGLLREGDEVLDEIELRELGDVRGKRLAHLQCHIGTDTLAWARRGAMVTGVDFSGESIACAERLRRELGLNARFIHSNIYDLPDELDGTFDIVYTSRGVLCWLRDLPEWGRLIARLLRPGGLFYILEAHPILNAMEEETPGELSFAYSYFHRPEPTYWDDGDPDYADPSYVVRNPSYEWTWSLSDIVGALLAAGLRIELLNEYDRLFFRLFPGMTTEDGRWFHLPPPLHRRLPLLFTLRARKPLESNSS